MRLTTGATAWLVPVLALLFLQADASAVRHDPELVDIREVPRGAPFSGSWIDLKAQVVHTGEAAVAIHPHLHNGIARAERAAGGFVLFDWEDHALVFVGDDGSSRELVTAVGEWAVEDSGRRVVFIDFALQSSDLDVVVIDVATGNVLASRRAYFNQIYGFYRGRVWTALPAGDGPRPDPVAGIWDVAADTLTPLPPRLAFAEGLDLPAGIVYGSLGGGRGTKFAPLDRSAGWKPWRTGPVLSAVASPDGRFLVTTAIVRVDTVLRIHRATSGEVVRTYRGRLGLGTVWEKANHVVTQANSIVGGTALVRLPKDGQAERISAFRRFDLATVPVP